MRESPKNATSVQGGGLRLCREQMKYIEVSKRINITREASQEDLKQALLARLRRAFLVEQLKERDSKFHLEGSSGGNITFIRNARISIDIDITKNHDIGRIFIHGYSKVAKSLLVLYTALFVFILLLGLAPGSIETSGESSGAADALVFLIFGIFIFYDLNKKLDEPLEYLRAALDSLDTEFG